MEVDSTLVDFVVVGFLAMAMPTATDLLVMATGMLDVDTTADTAHTALEVAAASTARSGVPTSHIIVVLSERQGSQVTPVFTP